MTKSILRYFIAILIVTLLSTTLLSASLLSKSLLESTKQDMLYSLKLIEYALDEDSDLEEQVNKLNPLAYTEGTRISVIDPKGNVLADTKQADISENHYNRPEVQEALQKGQGSSSRKSETTGEQLLYMAYYDGSYVVRLAIPYHGLFDHLPAILPAFAVSIVISFIISYLLSRKLAYTISKPIIEISDGLDQMTDDFRVDLKTYDYEEFNIIVETIHHLSHRLRRSMEEVRLEKRKMNEILKQMNEGFVLLDEKNKVLSINSKAIALLGDIKEKDDFLDYIYFPEIINALENKAPKQMIELKMQEQIYACYISRKSLGTTLLFVNITVSKEAEQVRSEFFSNVSHELKTPMTSIKGYSDLLAQGVVLDEEQRKKMLIKIQKEVDHMSRLIDDILMLSRMENKDVEVELTPIKIKSVVEEILESYKVEIDKQHIQIVEECEDVIYQANHQHIFTLLSNLIGNAVKYNKEFGSIAIELSEDENYVKIVVEDTGIGIPLADQTRVFERFYRVDKGRSRQMGGTGLGLAIVKHTVTFYNGTINLESILDQGTKIEIYLPKEAK